MHAVVFLKRILDPEVPAERFRIDAAAKEARVEGAPYVMGPYDENALETALKLKDQDASVRVTVVSYGPPEAEELLRKALSVGADDAVLVTGEAGETHDAFHVAAVLAGVVRRMGDADLLLCGLQSGDWDSGQTAFALAEHLDAASVALAAEVEAVDAASFVVRRVLEDGTEWVRVPRPAVLSVTNDGTNALRMAKVKDILAAKRKTVEHLTTGDLGVEAPAMVEIVELAAPEVRKASVTWIEGETGAERGRALAEALVAAHIV